MCTENYFSGHMTTNSNIRRAIMQHIGVSKEKKFFIRQVLVASVAFLQGINAGAVLGFSSILFAQLQQTKSVVLTSDQESWLASIPTIAMSPFCICSCWILKVCGRKNVALGCDILNMSSWLLIYFAHNYDFLLSGRIVQGMTLGILFPLVVAFVGEISSPRYRSTFLSFIPLGTMLGVFLVQLLSEYIRWRTVTLIFMSFSVYDIIVIALSKDSYVTYLDAHKLQQARSSFYFYQGGRVSMQYEFDAIVNALPREWGTLVVLKQCATKSFLVPFGITTLVFLTNEVSASQAVSFYTAQIVALITSDATFQYYSILLLNILRIFAVIASPLFVRLSSVRNVLLISGFLLGISLLVMALFIYLGEHNPNNSIYPIITLILLIMSAIFFAVGLGPLPSVVCGEMFPPITRANGCSWSSALSFLFLFFVVKFMPVTIKTIGIHWTFCLFGVCTLFGITACYFVVPNTSDKTLQEINDLYTSRTNEIVS